MIYRYATRPHDPGPLGGGRTTAARDAATAGRPSRGRSGLMDLLARRRAAFPAGRPRPDGHGTNETVLATHGPVALRRIPAGSWVQTCVKGEMATARQTALRRLIGYLRGDNLAGAALGTVGPVMQQSLAPGRWLVRLRLVPTDRTAPAPAPRMAKVKLVWREAETMARWCASRGGPPAARSRAARRASWRRLLAPTGCLPVRRCCGAPGRAPPGYSRDVSRWRRRSCRTPTRTRRRARPSLRGSGQGNGPPGGRPPCSG